MEWNGMEWKKMLMKWNAEKKMNYDIENGNAKEENIWYLQILLYPFHFIIHLG